MNQDEITKVLEAVQWLDEHGYDITVPEQVAEVVFAMIEWEARNG